ncbi:hypothetical protein WJX72_011936 [[Myrmecia] bisecta]|uniref:Nuclease associated modular domain-containing protein n=1 Tax=[Myrmecia] bisecta TaxID=41462 RepID=A0AAW1QGP1_9CHLO
MHIGKCLSPSYLVLLSHRPGASELPNVELARRAKISAKNKGKVPWNKGGSHKEETKAKISARTKEAMQRPEVLAKMKAAAHKPHTEETREKIRQALRAVWDRKGRVRKTGGGKSSRHRQGQTNADGTPVKEEGEPEPERTPEELAEEARQKAIKSALHRQRISEAIRKKWQDPEYREKVVSKMQAGDTQSKRTRSYKASAHRKRQAADRKLVAALQQQAKLDAARQLATQLEEALVSVQAQGDSLVNPNDPAGAAETRAALEEAQRMLAHARQRVAKLEAQIVPLQQLLADVGAVPATPDAQARLESTSGQPAPAALQNHGVSSANGDVNGHGSLNGNRSLNGKGTGSMHGKANGAGLVGAVSDSWLRVADNGHVWQNGRLVHAPNGASGGTSPMQLERQ